MSNEKKSTDLSTNDRARIQVVKGIPFVTSLAIAEHFDKNHFHVMRDIRNEIAVQDDAEFTDRHFVETVHLDGRGKQLPIFRLSELGFSLIAMGFTGSKASRWKRIYAETFVAMREQLHLQAQTSISEVQRLRSSLAVAEAEIRALESTNQHLTETADRLEHWNYDLLTQSFIADTLLTEGGTGPHEQSNEVYLRGLVGESMADMELFKKQSARELDAAKRAKTRPDYARYCASEIFMRIVVAMKWGMGNSCVIWGLLQSRAFTSPVVTYDSWNAKSTVLEPNTATMTEIYRHAGQFAPRETLYIAAERLQRSGFVLITEVTLPNAQRPIKRYQLRITALIECMQSEDFESMMRPATKITELSMGSAAPQESDIAAPFLLLDEFAGYINNRSRNYYRSNEKFALRSDQE
jgi:Rha family phage regulatory protein